MATPSRALLKWKADARKAETEKQWAYDNQVKVYRERDLLVRALSLVYPSHLMRHVGKAGGNKKPVVCIHSPAGQLAWTIPDDMAALYTHLKETTNDWDGHKTADRVTRLERL